MYWGWSPAPLYPKNMSIGLKPIDHLTENVLGAPWPPWRLQLCRGFATRTRIYSANWKIPTAPEGVVRFGENPPGEGDATWCQQGPTWPTWPVVWTIGTVPPWTLHGGPGLPSYLGLDCSTPNLNTPDIITKQHIYPKAFLRGQGWSTRMLVGLTKGEIFVIQYL